VTGNLSKQAHTCYYLTIIISLVLTEINDELIASF